MAISIRSGGAGDGCLHRGPDHRAVYIHRFVADAGMGVPQRLGATLFFSGMGVYIWWITKYPRGSILPVEMFVVLT